MVQPFPYKTRVGIAPQTKHATGLRCHACTPSSGLSHTKQESPDVYVRCSQYHTVTFIVHSRSLAYDHLKFVTSLGLAYAAVPLYRAFCAATGFSGVPVTDSRFGAERLVPVKEAKRIKVHFNADISKSLPWSFIPQQKFVSILPGETALAFYTAKNTSEKDIIGIATYNVTPAKVYSVINLMSAD